MHQHHPDINMAPGSFTKTRVDYVRFKESLYEKYIYNNHFHKTFFQDYHGDCNMDLGSRTAADHVLQGKAFTNGKDLNTNYLMDNELYKLI